ncbi:MAG: Stp1/IreP family PP2C-type Ser/Thr phosphatase [Sakamotonia sp.]|jgi:serine/threonine protein phosphatase PrpC
MNSYGQTDAGRVRKSNQDSIFLSGMPVGPLSNLFMVADGMGGHRAGDFASRFVVDTMVRCLERYKSDCPVTALRKAIEKTNELLFLEAEKDPDREGMGSTLVAATVDQDLMYVANVGDSRLYLFRDGLSQITRDHSLVEEMVSLGKMERNSESYKNQKNIITRAVGIRPQVTADFFEVPLKKEDCVLLCSDGLSNMVEETLIGTILGTPESLKEKTGRLIRTANENGGKDNIAVILIEPQISEVGV